VPNAAYEVLFTTNASKVEGEIKSLHQQVGKAIVPTVDLSNLKALNAELDLKQRHLRQTIAYFKQNQIKASMELSMPALTPAALQKALPSTEIKKVAQQQAKQLNSAIKAEQAKQAFDLEIVNVRQTQGGARDVLARAIENMPSRSKGGMNKPQLVELTGVFQKHIPGLEGLEKKAVSEIKQGLAKGLRNAGDEAIAGLLKALNHGSNSVKESVQTLARHTIKGLNKEWGVSSPAKEFIKIASYAIKGLVQGIQKEGPEAVKSIQALGKLMDRAMKDAIRKVQVENTIKPPAVNRSFLTGKTLANNGAEAGKDFSERLADGITSGASKAVAAAKKVAAQVSAAMRGGGGEGGGGGGGTGLGGSVPSGPSPSNLRALSGQTLGSFKRRQHVGGNQFVIEDVVGLYEQLAAVERKINRVPINSNAFRRLSSNAGFRQGEIERAQNISQVQRLRASGQFFEEGSLTRLSKQLQALQIEASQIKPGTDEWKKYQKEITKTTLEMEKLARTSKQLELTVRESTAEKGSIASLRAQLERKQMNLEFLAPEAADFAKTTKEMQRLERQMDRISRKPTPIGDRLGAAAGAVLYGGGLAGSPLSALGGIAGGLTGGIAGSFTGAAIGQTADQLVAASSASATYAANLSRLRIALAGVSGDFENYLANLKAVNDISNTYATSIDKVIVPYTKLQASVLAAGYSAQTTKEIFEGVTAASIATGGSADDLEGSMRAVTQIFAKGTVQSEELVGQLSERIPGAFALFAKFNNMSTSSLKDALQAGQVGLDNFIAFNKGLLQTYGQSAKEIAKGPEYAGQRLETALKRLQGSVGGSLAPIGAAFQDWATGVVGAFDQIIKKMQQYGVLSNQLSSSGIVEDVLAGRRTRKSVTDEISRLRKEEEVRNKAQTPFSRFVAKGTSGLGSAMGPLRFLPSNPLIPSSISATLLDQFFNSARNRQEGKLSTMSAAEASLKKEDEIIKNGLKEQAQVEAEQRKDQLKKLAEEYGNLMETRDRDLAKAREDYENDLQDLRKRHAQELLNFEETLADERRATELEIARTRRGIEQDDYDIAEQEQILLAKARGEDVTVAEKVRAFSKQVRTDREAVLRLEEDQITKQEKRQKELDKIRKQNAEDINKRAEEHAKRVKNIGEEHTKNVSRLLTKASVDAGKTLAQTTQQVVLQYQKLSLMTFRVRMGLHPTSDMGKVTPEIQRLQDQIDRLSGISKPSPSANKPKPLGQGGPDLPNWVMAQAQSKPVPESQKIYPADNRQYTAHPYGITGKDASGRLIIGPRPGATPPTAEMERMRATERQQAKVESDRLAQARIANLRKEYDELLDPLEQAKKTADEQNALTKTQANLLHDGVNPALIESLAIARQSVEKAQKRIAQEEESYKESLANGDLSLKQYETLTKFAAKLNDELSKRLVLSDREIAKNKEEEAALRTNLDIAKRSVLIRATPGIQTKTAELMLEGISDPGKASRFAKVLMDVEGDERIKSQFTSLGETLNSTLGNAIVNMTADWSNFSGTLQDSVKTLQDAFKQLANAIINEMTRAFVNRAVGWLMQVAGFGATLIGGSASPNAERFTTDTGIDTSRFALGNQKVFKFANGGIATGPTLGLIGEGRYNEAIIPMPNNRAVPVDLKGSVGSNYSTSIAVNISNSSAGATAESQITGDQGNKLAGVLDKAVKQAILSEQRPGGLLYRQ